MVTFIIVKNPSVYCTLTTLSVIHLSRPKANLSYICLQATRYPTFLEKILRNNPLITTPKRKHFSTINKEHAPVKNLLIHLIAAIGLQEDISHKGFLLVELDKPGC